MEQADAGRLQRRIILYKNDEAQRRAGKLKSHGRQKDVLDKADRTLAGIEVHGLADDMPPLHVHLFAHRHDDAGADRRHAEAADLNERGQKELPERRKRIAGVDGDQAGHTQTALVDV